MITSNTHLARRKNHKHNPANTATRIRSACGLFAAFGLSLTLGACSDKPAENSVPLAEPTMNDTAIQQSSQAENTDGVKMLTVTTPKGDFKVWTKKVGDNPTIKILILHGGPGWTHEAYTVLDEFFPDQGYEYYYYDQLGSAFSDQPEDESLWTLERFVDELEQVRQALGLNSDNFYIYGHSWGGMLAMEYALSYQQHIKGMIVSNMVSDIPSYAVFAENVLAPQLPADVLAEVRQIEAANDYDNPRYQALLGEHFYTKHVLRKPLDQWPAALNASLEHMNPAVYVPMQGPSEFGTSGRLAQWNRSKELASIDTPTLVIGAEHDTMDPKHMRWMATQFPNGQYLHCPNGSHMAIYDDQEIYMNGIIEFINSVDQQ